MRNPVPASWLPAGLMLLCACTSTAGRAVTATTTTAPAPTTTSTAPAPTTTVFAATAPQASPDKAASHLIAAWRTGDRAGALAAATTAAVGTVFAQPYPSGGLQFRNCSEALAGRSSCAYRVNSGLLTLNAVSAGGAWFIESAMFE